MGTTLENGVYLPSEGERNCYAGLKTNWEILDQKVADVTALQQAVAGALHRQIVASLPTTDIDPNTIYMVLSGTSATENVYNEFMYVNNAWELIGTSATDLTNYYTKAEVDGKLLLKANDSDVVHKSGNETIVGYKVFENICLSNSIKAINLENQTIDLNSCYSSFGLPQSGNISFYFCNTNNGTANISNLPEQSAFFLISQSIRILSGGSIVYAKQTLVNSNGKTFVRYCNNSVWDSWQNVTNLVTTDTAQTISGNKTFSSINGVEPGSLSLPSGNASDFIDISSYFDNTSATNSYTASANGWIYLRLGDLSGCEATVLDANNNRMWGQTTTGRVEQLTIPILKGQTLLTQWATTSTVIVDIARFIPCQGNV